MCRVAESSCKLPPGRSKPNQVVSYTLLIQPKRRLGVAGIDLFTLRAFGAYYQHTSRLHEIRSLLTEGTTS
jgi:hypothetical protein